MVRTTVENFVIVGTGDDGFWKLDDKKPFACDIEERAWCMECEQPIDDHEIEVVEGNGA
jgi:hypothetical protein